MTGGMSKPKPDPTTAPPLDCIAAPVPVRSGPWMQVVALSALTLMALAAAFALRP